MSNRHMIAPTNPSVSVDELMSKINEQIAGSRAASLLDSEGVRSLTADTVTAVANMEALIQTAESASQVRTAWGASLARFPFNVLPLRAFFLRVLAFIFRDQRQVNAMLIDAFRASLELNVRLCEQIDAMRVRLDAMERPKRRKSD